MNQICKVCDEPAAGFHFGAFTCEGCKVRFVFFFFRKMCITTKMWVLFNKIHIPHRRNRWPLPHNIFYIYKSTHAQPPVHFMNIFHFITLEPYICVYGVVLYSLWSSSSTADGVIAVRRAAATLTPIIRWMNLKLKSTDIRCARLNEVYRVFKYMVYNIVFRNIWSCIYAAHSHLILFSMC